MEILEMTSLNFDKEVLNSDKTVIIDFYANWCGPCKIMSKIIDEIAKEINDNVKIGKIDIDQNQDLAIKYGIMSIPTIMIFKNGQESKTFVGVHDKEIILGEI